MIHTKYINDSKGLDLLNMARHAVPSSVKWCHMTRLPKFLMTNAAGKHRFRQHGQILHQEWPLGHCVERVDQARFSLERESVHVFAYRPSLFQSARLRFFFARIPELSLQLSSQGPAWAHLMDKRPHAESQHGTAWHNCVVSVVLLRNQ